MTQETQNASIPSYLFIYPPPPPPRLSSFCGYNGLPACPLKTTSIFLPQDLCTCSSLSPLVLGSHVLRPPTRKKAFLPLCCSLSSYLAPSFSMDLEQRPEIVCRPVHTRPAPLLESGKSGLGRLVTLLSGSDMSTELVNGLWNE